MIKVLKKTFDILELVASRRGKAIYPGEITEELKLNAATCSRIIGDLVKMGYLEKMENGKAYQLGPKSFDLTAGDVYRKDILVKAESLVRNCAEEIKESVVLAVLKTNHRHVICHYNGNPVIEVKINNPYHKEDVYTTVTGRVLLAYSDKSEIEKIYNFYGVPDYRWDNISDKKELFRKLEEIRTKGIALKTDDPQLAVLAYPVFKDNKCVAALGSSVPKMNFTMNRKKILKILSITAEKITKALNS